MKLLSPYFFNAGPFAEAEEKIYQIGLNLYGTCCMKEYFYERQKLEEKYQDALVQDDKEMIKQSLDAIEIWDNTLVVTAQFLATEEGTVS